MIVYGLYALSASRFTDTYHSLPESVPLKIHVVDAQTQLGVHDCTVQGLHNISSHTESLSWLQL